MKRIATIASLFFAGIMVISCGGKKQETAQQPVQEQKQVKEEPYDILESFNENGSSKSLFSIAPDKQARFSRGNLQYQASTKTWRFAENQYDYIGQDNSKISSTNDGWIDLFGHGTSGWNSGKTKAYQPFSKSEEAKDYFVGSLTGKNKQADWGVHNAISNGGNKSQMWRTPTLDEWEYLLITRQCSPVGETENARFVKARVNNVNCIILFPDNYSHPKSVNIPVHINRPALNYGSNTYNLSEWRKMEKAGAILLPASGNRIGEETLNVGDGGCYSTSSDYEQTGHWHILFSDKTVQSDHYRNNACGFAVRLIMDKKK